MLGLYLFEVVSNFCMYLFEFCLVFVLGASMQMTGWLWLVFTIQRWLIVPSPLRPIILLPVAANLWIDPQTNTKQNSDKYKAKFKQIQSKIQTNTKRNSNKYKTKFKQIQSKVKFKWIQGIILTLPLI